MAAGELYIGTVGSDWGLLWRDANDILRFKVGSAANGAGTPGTLYISGNDLYYVGGNSGLRMITGANSALAADTPGKIFVYASNGYLYYHNSTGAPRYIQP